MTGAGSFVATTSLVSVRGLAFGPGDVLYAVDNDPPTSIAEDYLYTVDVSTGATTLVGTTGYFGVQGLAFDGAAMYAFDIGNGSGFGDGLVTIDLATGLGTDVSGLNGGSGSEVQTIFSGPGGELYGTNNELYSIDKSTGATTLLGGSGFSSLRGAEFVGSDGPTISVENFVAGGVTTLNFSNGPANGVGLAA